MVLTHDIIKELAQSHYVAGTVNLEVWFWHIFAIPKQQKEHFNKYRKVSAAESWRYMTFMQDVELRLLCSIFKFADSILRQPFLGETFPLVNRAFPTGAVT